VNTPRSARATGWGVALPGPLSQETVWEQYFGPRLAHVRGAKLAFKASGVRMRHAVVDPLVEDLSEWSTGDRMDRYVAEAVPLGKEALALALDGSALAAHDLGMLVTVSCTGYATPGVDLRIAESFGMAPTLERLHVGHMGCHAAFPALAAASRYVETTGRPAVVLSVELTSLHVQPPSDDLNQAVVHALFGDAAAAVVLEPGTAGPGLDVVDMVSLTETASADLMTWRVTDHGFRMTLSRTVPDVIARGASEAVRQLLDRNGLTFGDVATWAVHPGGPRILDRVGKALDLDAADLATSRAVLADHGNCSSATILMILDQIQAQPMVPGANVVAIGFGPGLTAAAILFRSR
jgi:alkylresorcinol/alkylpyrone synthase